MASFKVTDIIDGNTILVDGWEWKEYRGSKVVIDGYTVSNTQYAKSKLQLLLKNKEVELRKVSSADFSEPKGNDLIHCSVFLNDVNIADYFPELTTT